MRDDLGVTIWRALADGVAVLHAAYVMFVVAGLAAILVGASYGARWARNFWLRMIHFASIALVLAETVVGRTCPLTVLENRLRAEGGESPYPFDFIGYWTHRFIFYDWPFWVFDALYAGFTLAVLLTLILVPPEVPWRRPNGR